MKYSVLASVFMLLVSQYSSANSIVWATALRAGVQIDIYPAVGQVRYHRGMCSGTLIAPNMVLTAAHCVPDPTKLYDSYETCKSSPKYFSGAIEGNIHFKITKAGKTYEYPVLQSWSFGDKTGTDDVAILLLYDQVPRRVAQPFKVSSEQPIRGTTAHILGYGCARHREVRDGENDCHKTGYTSDSSTAYVKRMVSRQHGDHLWQLCAGDSGGPFFTNDLSIYSVASSAKRWSDEKLRNSTKQVNWVGDVTRYYDEITEKVDQYKNSCSIKGENGTRVWGACISAHSCRSNGKTPVPGFCPNHTGVECCPL